MIQIMCNNEGIEFDILRKLIEKLCHNLFFWNDTVTLNYLDV